MIYRELLPSSQLSDIVERFWSVEYEGSADPPVEPVLPDGCPEIVFNLGDRFERIPAFGDIETQATAIVSGQIRRRILIRPTGRVSLFGVRFQPYAAADFLGVSMSSLTDLVVPLSDVIGDVSWELEARIAEAETFAERVAIVETGLACRSAINDGLASVVTKLILHSAGRTTVKALVNVTGIGERRMERIFDRHLGVSPKMFSRIVRFRSVVRSIEGADSFGMLDTALSFGYFDQAHMIHEFNEFAGTNPRGYFEQTHRLSELFTS